jgi:hypothetical protein
VLMLSLTAVPGTFWEHLVVALFASAGLAVFSPLVGWAVARLWEHLDAEHRPRVGWTALGLVLLLFAVTVGALGVFRADELVRLTDNDFHIADPYFFGPLQTLLGAATALAAFRYFLADEGREAFRRLHEETIKLAALVELRDKLLANAERLLRAAALAEIDGVKAVVMYVHYPRQEAAEVKSVNSHGKFVSDWMNTVFLRDRFQPREVQDDGFVKFIVGYDERRFWLRRLVARAMMALAAFTLAVGITALALRHAPVAGIALLVALAFGALGVYIAHLTSLAHDDAVVKAFISVAEQVATSTSPNGKLADQDADRAVAVAVAGPEEPS